MAMEKELNLYQRLKPIEEKLRKAKIQANAIKSRTGVKDPLYWMNKIKEYEKEIDEMIKNNGK